MTDDKKQNVNKDTETNTCGLPIENQVMSKNVFRNVVENETQMVDGRTKNMEVLLPSRRYKLKMNRLFRERVGGLFLPYPEVDNIYEKVRSKIVKKLKYSNQPKKTDL